ncbi:MAG: HyaD/HybD family hydrogenase maturation endopeptidase [Candidatus Moduliflexus flocculans]|nr:HyaD/HybD family hydrogenase maturation endopeptidase [Candidatus Moduliflexus flocculans]
MTGEGRKVVLGLGNTLNRDEGLGVCALEPLRALLGGRGEVELLDGGVLGMSLLPLVESCSHLLLLDAVDTGSPPATVTELRQEEIPLFARLKLSLHQLGFQEVLQFAGVRGKLPDHLGLVGAQPADVSIGIGLSPDIEAVLPEIAGRALTILEEWGLV